MAPGSPLHIPAEQRHRVGELRGGELERRDASGFFVRVVEEPTAAIDMGCQL
jgi:hypothetical protein